MMEGTMEKIELLSGERFEPAQYSLQDLRFLLEHVGQAPAVAMRKPDATEPGVHPQSVRRLLTDVYNLEQIRAAEGDGFKWAGVESLADSIARFLAWHDRSVEIRRRKIRDAAGALITHPSQYGWDEDGKAFKGAVDADALDMVRTEITNDGSRQPFGVNLLESSEEVAPHISEIAPWIKDGPRGVISDDVTRTVEKKLVTFTCSICKFNQQAPSADRGKQNMAMARMRKHMKDAKTDTNRHRLLLNKLAR